MANQYAPYYRPVAREPLGLNDVLIAIYTRVGGGPAFQWDTESDQNGLLFRRIVGIYPDVNVLYLPAIKGDMVITQQGNPAEHEPINGMVAFPPRLSKSEEAPVTWTMEADLDVTHVSDASGDNLKVMDLVKPWSGVRTAVRDRWLSTHPHGGEECGGVQTFDMLLTFRTRCGGDVMQHRKYLPWCTFHGNSETYGQKMSSVSLNGTCWWPWVQDGE